jgi:hypothetical protein
LFKERVFIYSDFKIVFLGGGVEKVEFGFRGKLLEEFEGL